MAGEIGMGQAVARGRAVTLAIGQVLEDDRHGIVLGILRQPDARRQAAAVRHDDAEMGVLDDFTWEGGNGFHAGMTH